MWATARSHLVLLCTYCKSAWRLGSHQLQLSDTPLIQGNSVPPYQRCTAQPKYNIKLEFGLYPGDSVHVNVPLTRLEVVCKRKSRARGYREGVKTPNLALDHHSHTVMKPVPPTPSRSALPTQPTRTSSSFRPPGPSLWRSLWPLLTLGKSLWGSWGWRPWPSPLLDWWWVSRRCPASPMRGPHPAQERSSTHLSSPVLSETGTWREEDRLELQSDSDCIKPITCVLLLS